MSDALFRFPDAVQRDVDVEAWLNADDLLRQLARRWFDEMRACGEDVRETLHDGCPTACLRDAAFAYVGAFKAHVNVGFFFGAALEDPRGLLQGTGKRMRHVKLFPEQAIDDNALRRLIIAAHADIRLRMRTAGAVSG